jgi:prepilin-type N-terminal cleavage/methylation domain-containing protein
MHTHTKAGFSLIELLVVIVIIGLLSSIATTSYLEAQKTARDNVRKSDLHALSTALQTYFSVKQSYPGTAVPSTPQKLCEYADTNNKPYYAYKVGNICSSSDYSPTTSWIPGLGQFLSPFPVERRYQAGTANLDMLSDTVARTYAYRKLAYPDGTTGYAVYGRFEGKGDSTDKNYFNSSRKNSAYPPKSIANILSTTGVTESAGNIYLITK